MKTNNETSRQPLPSITGGAGGWVSHAFALIRADKLFSTIYIAGTAVAIASAMVVAIVLNIMLADIAPEVNRSQTIYVLNRFYKDSWGDRRQRIQHCSVEAIDSCFRQMKCAELVAAVIPPHEPVAQGFDATDEEKKHTMKEVAIMAGNPDMFRLYEYQFLSGRPFSEKEFQDGEYVCVITERVARNIGSESILLNGFKYRVVGIIKTVSFLMTDAVADVYVPYTVDAPKYVPDGKFEESRDISYAGNLYARILLKKGYSYRDFMEEFEPKRLHYEAVMSSKLGEPVHWNPLMHSHLFHQINTYHPDNKENAGLVCVTLLPPILLMLLFLLLPALNLSGLVSNRMEARRPEMGIRKAFGAKRSMLLREVLFENLVLTLLGGLAGWVLSWLIFSILRHNTIFQMLFLDIPMQSAEFGMNLKMFLTPTLFLVVFLCCAVLNLMVALIPAWRSLKNPIVESLNQKR